MGRVILIHWNAAEAEERASALRRAGHDVTCFSKGGAPALRELERQPPEAFVIGLDRRPSEGRDTGLWLRSRKSLRGVPLVFAGGERDKVEATRALLPDAVYATWNGLAGAVRRAMASPPASPAAPGVLAGYSGTPLAKKLGIREGVTVALLGAPDGFEGELGELPEKVKLVRRAAGRPDVTLLFSTTLADLEKRFPAASKAVAVGGRLWLCWPKKASGVASDLGEPAVRTFGLGRGWVDYKICAVDLVWSGLCFARRDAKA